MRLADHHRTRAADNLEFERVIDCDSDPMPSNLENALDPYDMLVTEPKDQGDQEVPGKGGGVGIIWSWFDIELGALSA